MTLPACFWTVFVTALLCATIPAAAQDRGEPLTDTPLDQLRPEDIPEYERRVATQRNGGSLPEGLVAILGDSRWQHPGAVRDIAVLPGGTQCLTSGDRSIILWDLPTGEVVCDLRHPAGLPLRTSATSADGRWLAAGSPHGSAILWNLPSGELLHTFGAGSGNVALDPGGGFLVTAGATEIELWGLDGVAVERRIAQLPTAHLELQGLAIGAERAAVSPDGSRLATTHWELRRVAGQLQPDTTRIVLWDTHTGAPQRTLDGHATRDVTGLVFVPDGRRLVSCGHDGRVQCWNVDNGERLWDYQTQGGLWVHDIAISPGGQYVWVLMNNDTLLPIDARNGRAGSAVSVPPGAMCFSFLPDGQQVALGLDGPRIVDLATGTPAERFASELQIGPIRALDFAPDGHQLATGGVSGDVVLWDLQTGRPGHRLAGHHAPVCAMSFSPDGGMLVSGDELGVLKFWEPATGRLIASHPGPAHPGRILFDVEGRFLAVGGGTGALAVWNLAEWKLYRSSAQLLRGTVLLAFVPESLALVTGNGFIDLDRNEYVRMHVRGERPIAATPDAGRVLWGQTVGNFYSDEVFAELHDSEEPAAAGFSADGRRVATFTSVTVEPPRFRLTVWDATTGKSLWSNDSLDVESADCGFAFTHDGRYVAYPAGNGTVHVVRIPLTE